MPTSRSLVSHKARLVAASAITVSLAVALAACGGTSSNGASGGTTTITLMGYSGVVQDNYTKAVVDPFMKSHPTIKVTYVPGPSAANMLGTLRSQKGNPNTDVAIFDTAVANTGNKSGIFQPLNPELVPNMKDIAKRGQVEGNFGPAVTFDNLALIYNTDKVKTKPTSWNDLWNPAFANQVVINAAPDLQGLSLMVIVDKMLGADYKQTIDPAVNRLAKLAPNVQSWNPNPDSYTAIINGSAEIGIGWNARAQYYAQQSNGKLGVLIPKEGSVFQTNSINLVKNAPHATAAQTFINYALSPEAQAAFTDQMFYAPTNTKATALISKQAESLTATTPARLSNIIDVDWNYIASNNAAWTQIWQKKILSQ